MEKWCEHTFTGILSGQLRLDSGTGPCVQDDWNFCPICGTPRPKEKELWEKMKEAWLASETCCDDSFKLMARVSEQHFKEKR